MLDQISISDCKKYIQVICDKKSGINDLKQTVQHVMSLYKVNGIDKVYIDERDRAYTPSTVEHLQIATFLSETTSGLITFSVLINEQVSNRDFFKTAASLRGCSVAYFNERSSALSWLMS
ncbi:MAG: hypothetical protein OEY11_10710 [Gammaproteobacteria bacterium]|nr:hypothetical protein [Gammaproteobacteria bacterium]